MPRIRTRKTPAADAGQDAPPSASSAAAPKARRKARAGKGAGGGDVLAAHAFLRVLGGTYLAAFLSLWLQVDGLFGVDGIFPVAPWLASVKAALESDAYRQVPTLFWLGAGDGALELVCALGTLAGLLIVLGRAQVPALVAAWVCYLSLVAVGREFLSFQWDALLLEAGLLAIFLLPPALRTRFGQGAPLIWPLWLLRWLLFRVMVGSGLVKLVSGDASWRHLTALGVHFETQPLPTLLGFWAHQLPASVLKASTLAMFVVEIGVPFLLLAPPRWRRWAFPPLAGLQIVIALTGNYGFFNLLTFGLCLLTLDDASFPASWRKRAAAGKPTLVAKAWQWAFAPWAVVSALLSVLIFAGSLRLITQLPAPAMAVYRALSPLRAVNSYGLFAVMTQTRDELFLEGSRDGREWRAYRFSFKPEDPGHLPLWLAPHMPRLDWQMWFAALGEARDQIFLRAMLAGLAEGRKPVVDLLANHPFPDAPPAFFRIRRERWRFYDADDPARRGAYWRREELDFYLPPTRAERFLIP